MNYLPRDFIETRDGLIFAVVDSQLEQGRVLGMLRYRRQNGRALKLSTDAANAWLERYAPEVIFQSTRLAARLHGVPVTRLARHYQPRNRMIELMTEPTRDAIEARARDCLKLLCSKGLELEAVGITGSLLIGAQHAASDLDFVIYDRAAFQQARMIVREAIRSGDLDDLTPAAWREAYARRGCELSFEEYLWHERRKFNKGLFGGTKFDITLVSEDEAEPATACRKLGPIRLNAEVLDASHAYDFPARYRLAPGAIEEVLSFSHTYAGQALAGEWISIAGQLEETREGTRRIIVGSTREAPGEFIKVLTDSPSTQAP